MITIADIQRDYEYVGHYFRRKDATKDNPSPLLTPGEVLEVAVKEVAELIERSACIAAPKDEYSTTWIDATTPPSNVRAVLGWIPYISQYRIVYYNPIIRKYFGWSYSIGLPSLLIVSHWRELPGPPHVLVQA